VRAEQHLLSVLFQAAGGFARGVLAVPAEGEHVAASGPTVPVTESSWVKLPPGSTLPTSTVTSLLSSWQMLGLGSSVQVAARETATGWALPSDVASTALTLTELQDLITGHHHILSKESVPLSPSAAASVLPGSWKDWKPLAFSQVDGSVVLRHESILLPIRPSIDHDEELRRRFVEAALVEAAVMEMDAARRRDLESRHEKELRVPRSRASRMSVSSSRPSVSRPTLAVPSVEAEASPAEESTGNAWTDVRCVTVRSSRASTPESTSHSDGSRIRGDGVLSDVIGFLPPKGFLTLGGSLSMSQSWPWNSTPVSLGSPTLVLERGWPGLPVQLACFGMLARGALLRLPDGQGDYPLRLSLPIAYQEAVGKALSRAKLSGMSLAFQEVGPRLLTPWIATARGGVKLPFSFDISPVPSPGVKHVAPARRRSLSARGARDLSKLVGGNDPSNSFIPDSFASMGPSSDAEMSPIAAIAAKPSNMILPPLRGGIIRNRSTDQPSQLAPITRSSGGSRTSVVLAGAPFPSARPIRSRRASSPDSPVVTAITQSQPLSPPPEALAMPSEDHGPPLVLPPLISPATVSPPPENRGPVTRSLNSLPPIPPELLEHAEHGDLESDAAVSDSGIPDISVGLRGLGAARPLPVLSRGLGLTPSSRKRRSILSK
jgi:hypothetical protein